jgi:glycogen synthase
MEKDKNEFVQEIKKQFELLKTERAKREGDWKEVQQYVAPSVFNWDNPADKTPKRPKRFTSRATDGIRSRRRRDR